MKTTKLEVTGERFMPEMDGVIRLEHFHRYQLARQLAINRDVLDLACGEGYGSALLASEARAVTGVDICLDAIQHAQHAYRRANLSFLIGSATQIPLPNNSVDLVISFETIEHLQDHDGFMKEIRRVLRESGVLLISSPSKAIYSDKGNYTNQFHQRELYTQEFQELIAKYFKYSEYFGQKTTGASVIATTNHNAAFVSYTDDKNTAGLLNARYDLILASDSSLPALPNSIYEIVDDPLQPERSEITIKYLQSKLRKRKSKRLVEYFGRWSGSLRKLTRHVKSRVLTFQLQQEVRACSFMPSLNGCRDPRLTVVAMARNEEARAHDTMRHFCALFDRVVLIDHRSDDDTALIAAGYDGAAGTTVTILRSEDEGYYQSEYMSAVANALISEGAADWIFFLDFDEFLPFDDVTSFRQALVPLTDHDVIHMPWQNLALRDPKHESINGAEAITGPTVSDHVKIAVNARRFEPGQISICQGNHAIIKSGNGKIKPYVGQPAFRLLHVPIVNPETFRKKIDQGCHALSKTEGKAPSLGGHWRDLQNKLDIVAENPDLMREAALNYGRPISDIIKSVTMGSRTKDTRPVRLHFAQSEIASAAKSLSCVPNFTLSTLNDVIRDHMVRRVNTADQLEHLRAPIYSTLPTRGIPAEEIGVGRDRIEHALIAAATKLEIVVPSAFRGHVPSLFALMETLRPRRYVELGTHNGGSFFAACQHMASNNNYGVCVAIDNWIGDKHSKPHKKSTFEEFQKRLSRHFSGTGRFIRSDFASAAACFQSCSIDLLLIDGLHTYAAVRQDFETWREKLDHNGLIIFHDTNEYRSDFGVWQLFDEISREATASFQFRHSHGLGILAYGTIERNPTIEMLQHFNARAEAIEYYFSRLGKAIDGYAQTGSTK